MSNNSPLLGSTLSLPDQAIGGEAPGMLELSLHLDMSEDKPVSLFINPIGLDKADKWETVIDFDKDETIALRDMLTVFINQFKDK